MWTERMEQFRNSVHGSLESGFLLTPPSLADTDLISGLGIMFRTGVKNFTIIPGSPMINRQSVSIEKWLAFKATSDSLSMIHAIRIQDDFGLPFRTVGHVTTHGLDIKGEICETRIYVHRPSDHGKGIGECALRLHLESLSAYWDGSVVAFVEHENTSSTTIHGLVYRAMNIKKGYPGKDYQTLAYEIRY